MKKVVAIVGSYRKNGVIDSAVSEILAEVEHQGAQTKTIYLQQQHIEFCTNCRVCLQQPGLERGECVLKDDMDEILREIESADALVIGSPVNFGNVNALTRLFLERCACYGYWPWDKPVPQLRNPHRNKKAILVSSSAAPVWISRFLTGTMKALKDLAKMLGAKPVGVLWVGLVTSNPMKLENKVKSKAKKLAHKLII